MVHERLWSEGALSKRDRQHRRVRDAAVNQGRRSETRRHIVAQKRQALLPRNRWARGRSERGATHYRVATGWLRIRGDPRKRDAANRWCHIERAADDIRGDEAGLGQAGGDTRKTAREWPKRRLRRLEIVAATGSTAIGEGGRAGSVPRGINLGSATVERRPTSICHDTHLVRLIPATNIVRFTKRRIVVVSAKGI